MAYLSREASSYDWNEMYHCTLGIVFGNMLRRTTFFFGLKQLLVIMIRAGRIKIPGAFPFYYI